MNLIATVAFLWVALPAPQVETDWGVHKASFDTIHGKVVVYLPDDLAAGDTISGMVICEPAGSTDRQRADNEQILKGTVVSAPGLQTSAGGGPFKWEVPAAIGAVAALTCGTSGGGGAAASVPVANPIPALPTISLPPIGQLAKPVECFGPFDGDYKTSSVALDGNPAQVLVKSPRKLVFVAPDKAGPCRLSVSERGKTAEGPFSTLAVKLTAGQTTLLPNQRTNLNCVVSGFGEFPAGPTQPTFELQVLSPYNATVEEIPGNVIRHCIRREDIVGDSYTYRANLIGVRPGAYSISAKVLWLWPWSKKKEPNPMLTKPPTPESSPFYKCCWLITVGPGKGAGDVDHTALLIDGKVYSFEGNGMNVYPNAGAYLNKRKFEDGRQVWVNPVSGVDKDAMRKKAQEIIDAGEKYDLFKNNCALNAAKLLEAGGKKDLLHEVKPLRLQNRNENLGEIGKSQEITEKQVE